MNIIDVIIDNYQTMLSIILSLEIKILIKLGQLHNLKCITSSELPNSLKNLITRLPISIQLTMLWIIHYELKLSLCPKNRLTNQHNSTIWELSEQKQNLKSPEKKKRRKKTSTAQNPFFGSWRRLNGEKLPHGSNIIISDVFKQQNPTLHFYQFKT